MTFPLLKKYSFQPRLDMCVSTCLKIVCDNQFDDAISIRQFNLWCNYEGKSGGGIAIDRLKEYLYPKLIQKRIVYNDKENVNIDFLYNLRKIGIYPIVIFHLRDYNEWKKKGGIQVLGDDEPNYHNLIVVDIDKDKQKILLFDTMYDKYRKKENDEDIYDEISYHDLYKYWAQ